ncbi:hypothetical protein RRG08_009598 [Elysia crispata]|uniref:Uncharacterized protein n=1 Tax=Elysia crispata TaxID=231223 RepID=A0AAE0XU69_9GAST|nr:hypothetical protein RRG08_009598 [Elysia crispata]
MPSPCGPTGERGAVCRSRDDGGRATRRPDVCRIERQLESRECRRERKLLSPPPFPPKPNRSTSWPSTHSQVTTLSIGKDQQEKEKYETGRRGSSGRENASSCVRSNSREISPRGELVIGRNFSTPNLGDLWVSGELETKRCLQVTAQGHDTWF